jgi:hypothetical protein
MTKHHVTFRFSKNSPVKEMTFIVESDSTFDAICQAEKVKGDLLDGDYRYIFPAVESVSTFSL